MIDLEIMSTDQGSRDATRVAAERWWRRGRKEALRGRNWGIAVICPEHLRPMGADWPQARSCGCPHPLTWAEVTELHGLEAITHRGSVNFPNAVGRAD